MSNNSSKWVLWVGIAALFLWAPSAWLGLSYFDHHDLRHHHLPWRAWAAQEWLRGGIPLWAPVGLGFPLAAEAQTGVFYPPTMLLFMIFDPSWALNLSLLLHLSLALFGMKRFVKTLGASEEASLFAAFAFAFGGLMSTHALYIGMFSAWAWLPWALWALWARRYGWLVVSLSAMVVAGHPQAAVLGWLLVGGLGLCLYWRQWKRYYRVCGSALLAAGITSPQWVSALELTRFSLRDGGLSTADAAVGSMPLFETISIVLPYFFGYERPSDIAVSYWHRGDLYWGAGINFWEMCTYVGVPILVCAILGYRRKLWLGLVIFAFLMMLGDKSPLWWVLHRIPPFNLLRFPVRFSIALVLGLSVLGAFGFDRIKRDEALAGRVSRRLLSATAVIILLFLLAGQLWAFAGESVFEWLQLRYSQRVLPPLPDLPAEVLAALPPPELPDPAQRARQIVEGLSGALSPVTHWSGLAAMLVMGLLLRGQKGRHWGLAVITLLFLELYWLGAHYQTQERAPMWKAASDSRELIEGRGISQKQRIATLLRHQPPHLDGLLLSSNLALLYGYEDVMVPSPLRLVRHEALLSKLGLGLGAQGEDAVHALEMHPELLDMIGVKYLLTRAELAEYTRIGGAEVSVYENEDALPFAWFLSCARESKTPWSALEAFKPREWVMVEEPVDSELCQGTLEYLAPEVQYHSEQAYDVQFHPSKSGYLVFRESWYPGWSAEVNGVQKSVKRVNWNLSAVRVDSGATLVKVQYSPWWLRPVGGLMIFSVLAAVGLVRRWRHAE